MWLLLLIVGMLAAAIAVQVVYARTYWAQANGWAKGLWIVNIGLLGALTLGLIAYAVLKAMGW